MTFFILHIYQRSHIFWADPQSLFLGHLLKLKNKWEFFVVAHIIDIHHFGLVGDANVQKSGNMFSSSHRYSAKIVQNSRRCDVQQMLITKPHLFTVNKRVDLFQSNKHVSTDNSIIPVKWYAELCKHYPILSKYGKYNISNQHKNNYFNTQHSRWLPPDNFWLNFAIIVWEILFVVIKSNLLNFTYGSNKIFHIASVCFSIQQYRQMQYS